MKEFEIFTPQTVKTKTKKEIMYKNATKLYDKLLSIYFNDYNNTTNEENKKRGEKYSPDNLLIEGFNLLIQRKKMTKKVNHSRKKLLPNE